MQPDVAMHVARYIAEYRALVITDALAVLTNPHLRDLATIAHRLAGTLASCGLLEAALLARRLEGISRPFAATPAASNAPDDVAEADPETRAALTALRRCLESTP